MVSSKELLGLLRLLAALSEKDKTALVKNLRGRQDNADSSPPPSSSREKVGG